LGDRGHGLRNRLRGRWCGLSDWLRDGRNRLGHRRDRLGSRLRDRRDGLRNRLSDRLGDRGGGTDLRRE
jgi:hypothetical protein